MENQVSNKRNQSPSYTDRILWHSLDTSSLKQVEYDSATDIFGSDHRIVFAQFLLKPRLFSLPSCSKDHYLDYCFSEIILSCSSSIVRTYQKLYLNISCPYNIGGKKTVLELKLKTNKKDQKSKLWACPYKVYIPSLINEWKFLEQHSIFFTIARKKIEDSQRIGFCFLNLKNQLQQGESFAINVTKYGQFIGIMSGNLSAPTFTRKGCT